MVSQRLPFGKEPVWATDGERVAFGSADEFQIGEFNRVGNLVRIIRWRAVPHLVDRQALEQFRREYSAFLHEVGPSHEEGPPMDQPPIPERMPTYSGVLFDDRGNLWVRQYLHEELFQATPQVQHWWVFGPTGRWMGAVESPPGLKVLGVHEGFLVGVLRDERDVESVQLYRLTGQD